MIFDISTTEATVQLSILEVFNLLERIRVGIEHLPTGTIPITIDIKTHVWENLERWRKSHGIQDVHSSE